MSKDTDFQYYAIILAAGSGQRMQASLAKQFMLLGGKPMIMHTIEQFANCSDNIKIILVLPSADTQYWMQLCEIYDFKIAHQSVCGGQSRFQSVLAGLNMLKRNPNPEKTLVAIHDGARPLASIDLINKCFESAEINGSGVAAVMMKDSVRQITNPNTQVSMALERSSLRIIQTPQTFRLDILQTSFQQLETDCFTDDASVVEAAGFEIQLIEGQYQNIKITTMEDIAIAELFLKK